MGSIVEKNAPERALIPSVLFNLLGLHQLLYRFDRDTERQKLPGYLTLTMGLIEYFSF
jgi:hypothetical protein